MDAAVLNDSKGVGELEELAGGGFRIGEGAQLDQSHSTCSKLDRPPAGSDDISGIHDFASDCSHCEQRLEKVETLTAPFDETLKGLRQKINDVELDTERRFLQKNEFDDFRKE